ncbi:endopeptidase La [Candidatus Deianiraea vastatrix]|uniref:Lon protease n=1 Tax=Candidatus Deianiraea vastatrix TaxID=2163644 RepID=A0A5B8XDH9_9RICK|nr:endopeptidase La [Candidatus Deianiraea vastatrix]QED23378.1 Lon protease [Candidatus Deianiraea vastatrix]
MAENKKEKKPRKAKVEKDETLEDKSFISTTFGQEQFGAPVVPVRDIVMFPGTIVSLFIGRKKSINAVYAALKNDRNIVFSMQYDSSKDEVSDGDMSNIAIIGTILQCISLPDETVKLLVDSKSRVQVSKYYFGDTVTCDYKLINTEIKDDAKAQAFLRSILNLYEVYLSLNKKVPQDTVKNISAAQNLPLAVDVATSFLSIDERRKLDILCLLDFEKRIEEVLKIISSEIEILKAEKALHDRVRSQIDKNQREYFLNEQMKIIKKELGDVDDSFAVSEKYREMMNKNTGLSQEAREKIEDEIKKLQNVSAMSSEAGIIKSYLDLVFALPWKKFSTNDVKLSDAIDILTSSHYGMDKAKDTIIEYIAVQKNLKKASGTVLCLHGAPGVGKTTLVRSIAKAMGREYVKISLGGLHDASELFGHRRTYIGALPGKIIQAMKKAKVSNPVILLDEIDKMSSDYRGDPASAMLEILDPEQNKSFNDHYLEVGYDISNVVFVATANSLQFSQPLRDRMELIHIPSYLEQEKLEIAKKYIVKKKFEECGLNSEKCSFTDDAISHIIDKYTREAGVRELERCVAKIARKNVVQYLKSQDVKHENPAEFELNTDKKKKKSEKPEYSVVINKDDIKGYLGVEKFEHSELTNKDMVGVVNGLAYTSAGGDVLLIEGVKTKGKGTLKCTGSLGNVMKESMEACYSYIRSNTEKFNLKHDFDAFDLHIHAPEGATPKDGPSAGVAISTNILSIMSDIPIKKTVAMTGEMTLRGSVTAIGGLREKLTAAAREKITDVIIPFANIKDLEEIPEDIKNKLKIHPCKTLDEAVRISIGDEIFATGDKKIEKEAKKTEKPKQEKKEVKKVVKKVVKKEVKEVKNEAKQQPKLEEKTENLDLF